MTGEIQRAQLFADVDELMAWKKGFELKQAELIAWQETMTKGCNVLVECDTVLGDRLDIVNKRLRKLENPHD